MIFKPQCGSLILLLMTILISAPSSASNSSGELELLDTSGKKSMAMLLDTEISGDVIGMLANINIQQTFKNNGDDWLNGRYVFPLPENAAVDQLTIRIGERIIEGVIKEKNDAKRSFEKAKRAGKKAGLLEQHRPNLFSVDIANIGPYEQIVATISLINKVEYQDGLFSLALPTTLTPRYVPNAPIALSQQQQRQLQAELESEPHVNLFNDHGWANNRTHLDDIKAITPPQTYSVTPKTSHHFTLDLSLRVGLELQEVSSPSHTISSNFSIGTHANEVQIALSREREPMNKDLILNWRPLIGSAPKAAMFQQQLESDFYTMLMITPPPVSSSLSLPRDVTFIIDSSGSMAGESMRQAKQALLHGLEQLNINDRFNIVDFDSNYRSLYSQSQIASVENLQNARTMIRNLEADGGTQMHGALEFALNTNNEVGYLQQIIFITDGAVGNEAELFKLIHQNLNDRRLFTVGIGSAPNAFFMNKAAKFGRGSYTLIRNLGQVNDKIKGLFEKINKPVLRDLQINWPTDVEQFPKRFPDLYAGQPITVLLKSSSPINSAEISGTMLNTPWYKTLTQTPQQHLNPTTPNNNIDTIWAREKIASLMDQLYTGEKSREQVRPMVTKLGISHHILTKFTAFVAIEKTPSKPESANSKHAKIPNLMPQGSTMAIPQTATPSSLLSLIGTTLLFLGISIRLRRQQQLRLRKS